MDRLEIAYWTLGDLNESRSNALFLCHGASGTRDWALPFSRRGSCFDPSRWFLISADLPGAGDSSRLADACGFPPAYTVGDLAQCVASLVRGLGLGSISAFCGPSLASMVGLELAFRQPRLVGALVLWQGGFQCDGYAQAVVETLVEILALDPSSAGRKAAARAFLPSVVARKHLAQMGKEGRDELVDRLAGQWINRWTPAEIIARYQAMAQCDLGERHGGADRLAAGIGCDLIALATAHDPIFPPESMASLTQLVPNAQLRSIESGWGHLASAAPPGSAEFAFFERETAAFLNGLDS